MDFLSSLGNYAFFSLINDFLRDEIDIFQWTLLQRTSALIGIVSLTVLTLWVMFQGYRIVTGQSREAAMGLVVTALRAALIIGLATSMAEGSSKLYWTLTDGVSQSITQVVTGDSESPYDAIDKNLGLMQIAMMSIDQIQTAGNQQRDDEKTRARWFTGVGMAGPGVVGGSLLLLNKIGMALFVGFGPLFIMCLLFQATKSLFSKWLLYGLGMVFSLSVLSFTVSLATKVIGAVAVAFLVKYAMPGNSGEGISSMALQQGGLGLVMTTLIVTAPPMAAAFFQGTLGQFTAYSALGQLDRAGQSPAAGRPYEPGAPATDSGRPDSHARGGANNVVRSDTGARSDSSPPQESGNRGLAQR
ncbi:type IV secretion system protein [Xanthomonas campestris pv. campestris]|uniref:type IV secretion system protein n=2 Tax=Xanthomonas campestris TaxID=339 RepID=UPI0023683190|nr:type IV secretion system protein [Xanthomonas campestris]MDO0848441.1 type IV secretion system protein [Xanthomonas campestris pv. campestris]MEB1414768.1 type IV secretion system protein [Xanthomonas campestris pv. campestris]MEB1460452.1 type IV secretion system protein [Xanthomonas campestris pv. campestris]MEB1501573.1 type IV secretion system protein [Xanthomonas campestris pv. campestris]MEB1525852.1 type IV secretion system protein [Xanthomonas campestris pv. campestris]